MTWNGAIRAFVLAWAMCLVTWSIVYVLTMAPKITGDTAAVLGTIITILTAAITFFEWRRHSVQGGD